MFQRIKELFKSGRCIKCNKKLTYKDKQKGGCGYINGKSFSYCVGCSQGMVTDLLSGKKPQIPKIMS